MSGWRDPSGEEKAPEAFLQSRFELPDDSAYQIENTSAWNRFKHFTDAIHGRDFIDAVHVASGLLEFAHLFVGHSLSSAVAILGPDSKTMALTYEDVGGLYNAYKDAKKSRLNHNSKMRWFWAEATTAIVASSAGVVGFSLGYHVSFMSAVGPAAGSSTAVAVAMPFFVAPVLLVMAANQFKRALTAHKKMDPLNLLEDRIKKYLALVSIDQRDGPTEKSQKDRLRYLHQIDALYQQLQMSPNQSEHIRLAGLVNEQLGSPISGLHPYSETNLPRSDRFIFMCFGVNNYTQMSAQSAQRLAHALHSKQQHKKTKALTAGTTLGILGVGIIMAGLAHVFPVMAIPAAICFGVAAIRTMKAMHRNIKTRNMKRDVINLMKMKLYSKDSRVRDLMDKITENKKFTANPIKFWKRRKVRKNLEAKLNAHIENVIARYKLGIADDQDVLNYVSIKGRANLVQEFCAEHAESASQLRKVMRGIDNPSMLDGALTTFLSKPENLSNFRHTRQENELFDSVVKRSFHQSIPGHSQDQADGPHTDTVFAPHVSNATPSPVVGARTSSRDGSLSQPLMGG